MSSPSSSSQNNLTILGKRKQRCTEQQPDNRSVGDHYHDGDGSESCRLAELTNILTIWVGEKLIAETIVKHVRDCRSVDATMDIVGSNTNDATISVDVIISHVRKHFNDATNTIFQPDSKFVGTVLQRLFNYYKYCLMGEKEEDKTYGNTFLCSLHKWNGSNCIIKFMSSFPRNANIQWHGCYLINQIRRHIIQNGYGQSTLNRLLYAFIIINSSSGGRVNNGMDVLITAIENHPTNLIVLCDAFQALNELRQNANIYYKQKYAQKLIQRKVLRRCVEAIRNHPHSTILVTQTLDILHYLDTKAPERDFIYQLCDIIYEYDTPSLLEIIDDALFTQMLLGTEDFVKVAVLGESVATKIQSVASYLAYRLQQGQLGQQQQQDDDLDDDDEGSVEDLSFSDTSEEDENISDEEDL